MAVLFSIITVTRNNLAGLERTGESLKAQSCGDYEWIVVDGASSDGSVDYLKNSDADWVSEPDQGIYDAMNKEIEKAQGDYLVFMNAGDMFADGNVLSKIQKATRDKPDFIYGDVLETREAQEPAYKKARAHSKSVWGMFTHHQAMIYRRKSIGNLRYDLHYKIAADYDFTLRFLQNAEKIRYCPVPICIFECGGVSQQNAALGRTEQRTIRSALHRAGRIQNAGIALVQKCAWFIRCSLPKIYWNLKRKKLA